MAIRKRGLTFEVGKVVLKTQPMPRELEEDCKSGHLLFNTYSITVLLSYTDSISDNHMDLWVEYDGKGQHRVIQKKLTLYSAEPR